MRPSGRGSELWVWVLWGRLGRGSRKELRGAGDGDWQEEPVRGGDEQ